MIIVYSLSNSPEGEFFSQYVLSKAKYYDDAEVNILVQENSFEGLWEATEMWLYIPYAAFKHQGGGDVSSLEEHRKFSIL